MKYTGKNNELFEITDVTKENCELLKQSRESELSLLWSDAGENSMTIDSVDHSFTNNQMVFLTEFNKIKPGKIDRIKLLRFNRSFYCILDHDSEVSCKGILYYGASDVPILNPSVQDIELLEVVWKIIHIEMASKDELQLEMLQMMLKRTLILCTRIYKKQNNFQSLNNKQVDIIREFNYLVEENFRKLHSVTAYASLLNKSPKTLSNLFNKITSKSPLQFIQERLMLEARRLLSYTDRSITEIGYGIGFEDIQSFSRFFKIQEGISPSDFRDSNR